MKKLCLLPLTILLVLTMQAAEKIMHLSFDEEGTLRDDYGNFTLNMPKPLWDSQGAAGKCLRFDTQDEQNFLTVVYNQKMNFPVKKNFTLEFCYYPEKCDGKLWSYLLSRESDNILRFRSSAVLGRLMVTGATKEDRKQISKFTVLSAYQSALDEWHHVAFVRNAEQSMISIYFDGKLVKEMMDTSPDMFSSQGGDYQIGRYFKGKIDEVILWNDIVKEFKLPGKNVKDEEQVTVDPWIKAGWDIQNEKDLHLCPSPKNLTITGPSFQFLPAEWKVERKSPDADDAGFLAFEARLKKIGAPALSKDGKNVIIAGLWDEMVSASTLLSPLGKPPRQGYVILFSNESNARRIFLTGSDAHGLRYAWLTLANLLKEDLTMYPITIKDWPDFNVRVVDVAFHIFNSPETIIDEAFQNRFTEIKMEGRYDLKMNWDAPKWRSVNSYAARHGISIRFTRFTELFDIGEDYKKYIKPGFTAHYYPYKPEEGLIGYKSYAFSWSRDDLAAKRGKKLGQYMKERGFRNILLHPMDCGGKDNPGNWNYRTEMDRKRWGDDRAGADANLLGILADGIRSEIPDCTIFYPPYPYNMPDNANDAQYLRRLTHLLKDKVHYLIRECPKNRWQAGLKYFEPYPVISSFYACFFSFYPGYSNAGRFMTTFLSGHDSSAEVVLYSTIAPIGNMAKAVAAEYMWNANAPGAENMPLNKNDYPVVFASSAPIEQELLPRLCALYFGEKAAKKLAEVYAFRFSDRLPEHPNNILPANVKQIPFFENMLKNALKANQNMNDCKDMILPDSRQSFKLLDSYLTRLELLCGARLSALKAREYLDKGDIESAKLEAAKGMKLLESPEARGRDRYKPILTDLDIANFIGLYMKRGEYLKQITPRKIRVAFYLYTGTGSFRSNVGLLPASFNGQGGVEASTISDITRENLKNVDVVIFNADHDIGDNTEDWKTNLRSFVQNGGGVIFTHNACGRHVGELQPPVFSEICLGITGTEHDTSLRVVDPSIFENSLKDGDLYSHTYYDHCNLIPGDKGKIILTSGLERPVLLAGIVGKGRVVYSGEIFGVDQKNRRCDPGFEEWRMLFELIRWVSNKS